MLGRTQISGDARAEMPVGAPQAAGRSVSLSKRRNDWRRLVATSPLSDRCLSQIQAARSPAPPPAATRAWCPWPDLNQHGLAANRF